MQIVLYQIMADSHTTNLHFAFYVLHFALVAVGGRALLYPLTFWMAFWILSEFGSICRAFRYEVSALAFRPLRA